MRVGWRQKNRYLRTSLAILLDSVRRELIIHSKISQSRQDKARKDMIEEGRRHNPLSYQAHLVDVQPFFGDAGSHEHIGVTSIKGLQCGTMKVKMASVENR